MKEIKFNSQICTSREQSERLLALGLKKETADMGIYYSELYGVDRVFSNDVFEETPTFDSDEIPAWSLHRLIELIWGDGEHDMSLETHRPYEDCIERIDYMINQSHCFNKEYLEEQAESRREE